MVTFLIKKDNKKHVVARPDASLPGILVLHASEIYYIIETGSALNMYDSSIKLTADEVLLWHLVSVPIDRKFYLLDQ